MKESSDAHLNTGKHANLVELSDHAKNLQSAQIAKDESEDETGKESVQVSSSIGRISRVTGLQREEVAALYRSIDKLTES